MGVFLQIALFPGCEESPVRKAVETAAKDPAFSIDPAACRYAKSYEGTQVLMEGGQLGFAPLAKALSLAAINPVMVLYIYDGDYWGYDFYGGNEEDHFSTLPDYFGPVSQEELRRLTGHPSALMGWFPIQRSSDIDRYLIHWPDDDLDELEEMGAAYPGDQYPYGDCWQVVDFMARLGFPWPFEEPEHIPIYKKALPTLHEILEKKLPSVSGEDILGNYPLLCRLPSAFSTDYIQNLLLEDGMQTFHFADKTPQDIIEAVNLYCWDTPQSECNPLCQRLSVLAAFCSFWMQNGDRSWGFLDRATYEPVWCSYEKPTDVRVLRTRAAVTDFSKRHRAIRDLERLQELDPANRTLYQAEIQKWNRQERIWQEQQRPQFESLVAHWEQEKKQQAEKEQKRLQLILEKRRKKTK